MSELFIMSMLAPKDFTYEFVLGEKILEKLKGDLKNLTLRKKIPGKNISSFNTLKDKTKQIFADVLDKVMIQDDFDLHYELNSLMESSPKEIKSANELNKYLMNKP